MQIPLLLDRSRSQTLTVQLAEQLREAVQHGRIPAGGRLPSSRHLAEQLDISRNTVTRAYEMLIAEGYVESRPASGIFAAAEVPGLVLRSVPVGAPPTGADAERPPMPAPIAAVRFPRLVNDNRARVSFDFFPGRPSASLFPMKTWRRLLQACLSKGGSRGLAEYGPPAGLAVLRSAIAGHLALTRGLIVDPEQIVVVSGIQEGISLAARLYLSPGSRAIVESPSYQGAAFVFEACGADVVGIPVDGDGIIADYLPEGPASLLYLTPSHQYPTGYTLSSARRLQIAAWARASGCYILEDDYDSDFRYEGSPLPALAAAAPDCVIYLGTFSKSLGAGLRVGYMVLPAPLADAARGMKALLNNGNPWLEQAVLAEFLQSGSYAAHVMRIRGHYRDSRDALLAALKRNFGDISISGESGGLHLFWELPSGVPDAAILEVVARRARVGVYSLASGGAHEVKPSALSRRGIVLGYASMTPRQIEQGIGRLSAALDDALDAHLIDVDALIAPQAPPIRAGSPDLASYNRQRPALRERPRSDASSRRKIKAGGGTMATISGIFRYPVKGLSPQALSSVALEAGRPFPQDRIFALARPGSVFDQENPQWAKKGMFIMLMLEEALASVTTSLDVGTDRITVMRGNELLFSADLGEPEGRAAFEAFFHSLLPTLRDVPRLIRSSGGHFMDKPDEVISLINLATLRSLEAQWGFEIDPLRFRANVYIDGAEPWQEFDWIGGEIRLGEAICMVDRRNGRCSATNVNPATGRRDLDIPGSLRAAFGHKDLGVYLTVRRGGSLAIGNPVEVDGGERSVAIQAASSTAVGRSGGARRFMCRGCYFIYEEAAGLPALSIPAGTGFGSLSADWRCPDCGSDKPTFRPYVA